MDKQQIILFIEEQIATGKISKNDLLTIAGQGVIQENNLASNFDNQIPVKEDSSKKIINTFYGIGATIVIVGVIILMVQHWGSIGFAGRILATLGISLITYIAALMLNKPEERIASQVMFTIAAVLAPLGSYVLLKQAGISFDWTTQVVTSFILLIIFGSALFISKRNVLMLITVGFVTWFYYVSIMKILNFGYYGGDFLKWATMILGVSYISTAYGHGLISKVTDIFDAKEKRAIQNVLYGFGTLAVLGAGISVGGIFDLIFIAFIFGAFYGSVYLKSRSMLIFGALFLMSHIIKLTSKYFVNSVGWPLALIVIGFLVIGVGYMTLYLNKKFISVK